MTTWRVVVEPERDVPAVVEGAEGFRVVREQDGRSILLRVIDVHGSGG